MKILMLCDFYGDNIEYQENLLAKYYIKLNHDVTIIASTFRSVFDYYANKYDKDAPKAEYFDKGAKIIRLPYSINYLGKIRKYKNIFPILEKERPDLIFSHDIKFNLLDTVKYKKINPNCRIIMDCHADYSNSASNWLSLYILHKVIRKYIFDRAKVHISKIFPIVPASASFLNEVYKVPYEIMELLPLGVDLDIANAVIHSKEGIKIRRDLSIPENDIVIFTGGKLTPEKKTDMLINSFFQISNPHLHLIIVGDTPIEHVRYKDKLLKLCNSNKRIHFVGWVSSVDLYKYMNACDFAVYPASQSVLWQQSIGMGLPLIIGKTVHLNDGRIIEQDAEYLNRNNNIIILNDAQNQSYDLVKYICKLIDDKQLLNGMKLSAQTTAQEYLAWDKLILKTLEYN